MIPHPPRPQGSSKEARFMQWVWEKLTGELKPIDNPSAPISRTTRGWFPSVKVAAQTAPPTPGTLDPFTIFEIKGDYLICTPRGGGARVNIAKSPCLWQSTKSATIEGVVISYSNTPYAGTLAEFYRRDATAQGITIKEEITPPYIVGQPIYAIKLTGGSAAGFADGAIVDYVSVADPRAWGTRSDQST